MTHTTKHLTVRVNRDESVTLLMDDEVMHLGEFGVHDLIDSLAALGYGDYMITAAQGEQLEAEEHDNNPFVTCLKSLAESN
jgi:hypothetical protein